MKLIWRKSLWEHDFWCNRPALGAGVVNSLAGLVRGNIDLGRNGLYNSYGAQNSKDNSGFTESRAHCAFGPFEVTAWRTAF